MIVPFSKMQGLGNDFVLIDRRDRDVPLDPATVRRIADRRFGVGCDQVLALERGPGGVLSYRIFNGSGEEVEHCGNGVRCVARYLAFGDELCAGETVAVVAGDRDVLLTLEPDGRVRVDMGVPEFEPARIPLARPARAERYEFTLPGGRVVTGGAVSMGNPHLVLEVSDVVTADVAGLGPVLERHPDFPNRVNVGFAQFAGSDDVRLRVYERGVGETPACGTGACAAVAVGRAWGRLAERVSVELVGGTLEVAWRGGDDSLSMTGPAERTFEGRIEL